MLSTGRMTRKRRTVAMSSDSNGASQQAQDGTSKYPHRTTSEPTSHQERAACPLYTAIAVIDGRWKPMILQRLGSGALGFGALHRAMRRVTGGALPDQP